MSYSVTDGYKVFYPKITNQRPHVEVDYDDSALMNKSSDTEKNIFLVGSSTQGNPNTVYKLNSLGEAKAAFGSGDLVNAAELAWNPESDGTQSGGTIYAVRVENATQATLDKGSLRFVSDIYGSVANNIGVSFDNDVVSGGYRLEVVNDSENYDQIYSGIGNIFVLSYNGTAAAAGYAVTADASGNPATFDLLTGSSASTLTKVFSMNLTKSSYSQIYNVMNAISAVPGFSCTPVGSASTSILTEYLDITSGNVALSQTGEIVTAVVGDLINTVNNSDDYVSVEVLDNAAPSGVSVTPTSDGGVVTASNQAITIPSAFSLTYLVGGSDGEVPTSWADKFEMIHGLNAYYIVPLTDQSNVHAELRAFLEDQDTLGYEYIGWVGGGYSETTKVLLARQAALKSGRIALVANSGYYTNLSGTSVHIPAYLMAAFAAGVASSLDIGEAITNKYISLVSLDTTFSQDDLNTLDTNGVIVVEDVINRNASGGFRFVEDVTTLNSSNEPVNSLVSLRELTDFLLDGLRLDLEENFVGTPIRVTSADLLASEVSTYLSKEVSAGLIDSYNEDDITVTIDGNQAYIVCSAAPAQTLRNIVLKMAYTDYKATATGVDNTATSTTSD